MSQFPRNFPQFSRNFSQLVSTPPPPPDRNPPPCLQVEREPWLDLADDGPRTARTSPCLILVLESYRTHGSTRSMWRALRSGAHLLTAAGTDGEIGNPPTAGGRGAGARRLVAVQAPAAPGRGATQGPIAGPPPSLSGPVLGCGPPALAGSPGRKARTSLDTLRTHPKCWWPHQAAPWNNVHFALRTLKSLHGNLEVVQSFVVPMGDARWDPTL